MVYTIDGEQLTRRKLVTIDGSQVTTQTGIPLMLNIDLPNVATDGKDVRLAKLDGTPIAREIECVDVPNTDSVTIHYPFDTVASTDSQFYVYWGNASLNEPAADSTYGSQAVWGTEYKLVALMNNDPNGDAASSIKDSTSNANHGTPSGSMTTADLIDGDYGRGIDFDGSNDFINFGSSTDFEGTTAISIIAVIDTDDWNTTLRPLVFKGQSTLGYYIWYPVSVQDRIQWRTSSAGNYVNADGVSVSIGVENTVAVTHDTALGSNNRKIFYNGSVGGQDSDSNALDVSASENLYLGNYSTYFLDARVHTLRIANIGFSNDYMATTSKNLKNPTASGTAPFYKSFSEPKHQRRHPHFVN
jgi:hypothetical protein